MTTITISPHGRNFYEHSAAATELLVGSGGFYVDVHRLMVAPARHHRRSSSARMKAKTGRRSSRAWRRSRRGSTTAAFVSGSRLVFAETRLVAPREGRGPHLTAPAAVKMAPPGPPPPRPLAQVGQPGPKVATPPRWPPSALLATFARCPSFSWPSGNPLESWDTAAGEGPMMLAEPRLSGRPTNAYFHTRDTR